MPSTEAASLSRRFIEAAERERFALLREQYGSMLSELSNKTPFSSRETDINSANLSAPGISNLDVDFDFENVPLSDEVLKSFHLILDTGYQVCERWNLVLSISQDEEVQFQLLFHCDVRQKLHNVAHDLMKVLRLAALFKLSGGLLIHQELSKHCAIATYDKGFSEVVLLSEEIHGLVSLYKNISTVQLAVEEVEGQTRNGSTTTLKVNNTRQSVEAGDWGLIEPTDELQRLHLIPGPRENLEDVQELQISIAIRLLSGRIVSDLRAFIQKGCNIYVLAPKGFGKLFSNGELTVKPLLQKDIGWNGSDVDLVARTREAKDQLCTYDTVLRPDFQVGTSPCSSGLDPIYFYLHHLITTAVHFCPRPETIRDNEPLSLAGSQTENQRPHHNSVKNNWARPESRISQRTENSLVLDEDSWDFVESETESKGV